MKLHTGEGSFDCDVCGMKLSGAGALKRHSQVHTGEKPYECDVCGWKFTQAGGLKRHMRTHTGEKPYACDVCNKGFAELYHLNVHLRSHTGEKPFVCQVCGKAYTQNFILKKHELIHVNEKKYYESRAAMLSSIPDSDIVSVHSSVVETKQKKDSVTSGKMSDSGQKKQVVESVNETENEFSNNGDSESGISSDNNQSNSEIVPTDNGNSS